MALSVTPITPPIQLDAEGVARISGTRVTLDTIVHAFQRGATPEQIADKYPALSLRDVYLAISYYLDHRAEVDAYLDERSARSVHTPHLNEARFDPNGIRARLLARR